MRRPREIYHLALLARSGASAVALGRSFTSMLGVLDAARRSRRHQGHRHAPGHVDVRVPVGPGPAGAGGGAAAPGRARRRRQGHRRPARARTGRAGASSSRRWPRSTVYGPRQRPDAAVLAGDGRGRGRRSAGRGSPATAARPATSSTSTTSSTRWCGRVGGAAGSSSTSAPASRRRCATCGRCVAPEAAPPTFVAARPDELARFAVSPVRARIHLAWSPWTSARRGARRPPLNIWARCVAGRAGSRHRDPARPGCRSGTLRGGVIYDRPSGLARRLDHGSTRRRRRPRGRRRTSSRRSARARSTSRWARTRRRCWRSQPGDRVTVETRDAFGGVIHTESDLPSADADDAVRQPAERADHGRRRRAGRRPRRPHRVDGARAATTRAAPAP